MNDKDNKLIRLKNNTIKASVKLSKAKKAVADEDKNEEKQDLTDAKTYRFRNLSHRIKYGKPLHNTAEEKRENIPKGYKKLVKNKQVSDNKQKVIPIVSSNTVKINSKSGIVKAVSKGTTSKAQPTIAKLRRRDRKNKQLAIVRKTSRGQLKGSVIRTSYNSSIVDTRASIARSATTTQQQIMAQAKPVQQTSTIAKLRRRERKNKQLAIVKKASRGQLESSVIGTNYNPSIVDTRSGIVSSVTALQPFPKLGTYNSRSSKYTSSARAYRLNKALSNITSETKTTYNENYAQLEQNFLSDTAKQNDKSEYKKSSRIKVDKALTTAAAANMGIKLKNDIAYTLNYGVHSTYGVMRNTAKATAYAVADAVEDAAENDIGLAAVDLGIKTARGAKTAIATVRNTAKVSISLVNGSIKATQKTVKAVRKTVKLAKKVRKYSKLNKKAQSMYRKALYRNARKRVAKAARDKTLNFAKSFVSQICALVFVFLLILIVCAGFTLAVFGSLIFQTESVLDTTQLVKYISELDANMQSNWYQGNTAAEITRYNDTNTRRSIEGNYYMAYNKLPDTLPAPTDTDPDLHSYIKIKFNPENGSETVAYRGYTSIGNSKDEVLESYRWTTDDYITALAYLQVQNENLGWFASTLGWVGEYQLKIKAKELHDLTYGSQVVIEENTKTGMSRYSLETGEVFDVNVVTANDTRKYYYFGKKNSVKFLIENDLIAEPLTDEEKERFENICKYGNAELAIMQYPLDGDIDIAKHFGKQCFLKFNPAADAEAYPSVTKATAYHYAVDLNTDEGDIIQAPFSGFCKVSQKEKRGFEYVISTNPDFESGGYGYLCRISCSGASYIPIGTTQTIVAGQALGTVSRIQGINTDRPTDTALASKLYPCSTNTDYHSCDNQGCTEPNFTGEYVHLELYKLPCDFTSATDMEKNVLAPELFFIYPEKCSI